jgi:hypothetical protein
MFCTNPPVIGRDPSSTAADSLGDGDCTAAAVSKGSDGAGKGPPDPRPRLLEDPAEEWQVAMSIRQNQERLRDGRSRPRPRADERGAAAAFIVPPAETRPVGGVTKSREAGVLAAAAEPACPARSGYRGTRS